MTSVAGTLRKVQTRRLPSKDVQPCKIIQILHALGRPSVMAGLVLGAHEHVRTPALVGRAVRVAPVASDGFLDMPAIRLCRLESPIPPGGVDQELVQFTAAATLAFFALDTETSWPRNTSGDSQRSMLAL